MRATRDSDYRALLDDLQRDGWRTTTTTKGHHRCLAPDGVTTLVFSGSPSDRRALANARSNYRRWQRQQGGTEVRVFTCEECGTRYEKGLLRNACLARHSLARNREENLGKRATCERCGRDFVPGPGYARHLHWHAAQDAAADLATLEVPEIETPEVAPETPPPTNGTSEVTRLLNDVDAALELLTTAWATLRPLVERSEETDAIERIKQILGVR